MSNPVVIHAAESLVESVRNDVNIAQAQLGDLIGNDSGKSARTIAAEEVAKVVANAPADFDTLKEIADYIESDKTGAAEMVTQIDANAKAINAEVKRAQDAEAALGEEIAGKVDKVDGKKLSTEDYTTAEKEKLGGIEAGAQVNITPVSPSPDGAGKPADAADVDYLWQSLADAINDVQSKADEALGKADEVENGLIPTLLPRYPFVDTAIVDGVVTLTPYSRNSLTSDGTAFTVLMGGSNTHLRDCVFVVTAGDTAPNISWGEADGQKFNPRTDEATDMVIAANTTKVFWVTEYAEDKFAVAGWEVPSVGE